MKLGILRPFISLNKERVPLQNKNQYLYSKNRPMLNRLLFFILMVFSVPAFATHNRAGEITYEHISGLQYKATITTYTKTSAFAADRPELEIKWGDSSIDTIPRTQIIYLPGDAQKNLYYGYHTYAGPGTFVISMEDPNRNEGVVNIPSSVSTVAE